MNDGEVRHVRALGEITTREAIRPRLPATELAATPSECRLISGRLPTRSVVVASSRSSDGRYNECRHEQHNRHYETWVSHILPLVNLYEPYTGQQRQSEIPRRTMAPGNFLNVA